MKLVTLPSEVSLSFAECLPSTSVLYFALRNRRLMQLLGARALETLRLAGQAAEKRTFLSLLEKDLHDHIFCHHCHLFHPVAQVEGPRTLWRYHDEPKCVQVRSVQLNDRQSLFHRIVPKKNTTDITTQIQPLIMDGELFLLIQTTLLLLNPSAIGAMRHLIPETCPHMTWLEQNHFGANNAFCYMCYSGKAPCFDCRQPKSCRPCSTELEVSWREVRGAEIEIDIIRKDLGACRTPFDDAWFMHTNIEKIESSGVRSWRHVVHWGRWGARR